MPIRQDRIVAGYTASLKLVLTNLDEDGVALADSSPMVKIYDPRGRVYIDEAEAEPLGSGQYLYNFETPSVGPKGNWRAIFSYEVDGVPFADDVFFNVVGA